MRHERGRDEHVARFRMLQARIERRGGQRRQDPRPRAQRVVRDVEPQHGKQSMPLIARAENPLRDVTAAARLRSRIPERPPLHSQMHQKREHRQRPQGFAGEPARKIRKHRRDARRSGTRGGSHRRKFSQHRGHAARAAHAIIRDGDHDPHFQHELKQIRPQHAPQSAERNVKSRERNQKENADRQARRLAFAEHGSHDAGHRLGDPAEDQAIHQQAEIDGAKSAQKRGGFSRSSASPRIARR